MWLLYIIAFLPMIIGAVLWMASKKINWLECLGGTALAFAVAGIMHLILVNVSTYDTETWSGTVSHASHVPQWVEQYEEAVYRTETYSYKCGKNSTCTGTRSVFSHYETRYRRHSPSWTVYSSYGNNHVESYNISSSTYQYLKNKLGEENKKLGYRSGYYSGDRYDYYLVNKNKFNQPTTSTKRFKNKVKGSPSVFAFNQVPTNINVFEYPENKSLFSSDRLLGTAVTHINLLSFDQMNSRLGPKKKVNVIMVGFPKDAEQMIAQHQQNKWWNGKKNDLVICYSQNDVIEWSFTFGWTEKEIVKRNIDSLLIGKKMNDNLLFDVEKIIEKDYIIKDWSKFDYLEVEPKPKHFIIYGIILFIAQVIYWIIMFKNEHNGFGLI